ncbi:MAG: allophanate hydrolase [Verrucomicrobia bacterium]|nr:allophanate hydrolase [Verrucomicrobiota bacterium]
MELTISALLEGYRTGAFTPEDVIHEVYRRMEARKGESIWISLVPLDQALDRAKELPPASSGLPLYGIPFSIKDNIDLAGIPTTAACPAFSYLPERSAKCVSDLLVAGAIPVGKTNLDQFATGLVGTRSPYGIPRSVFDPSLISGGSSAGAAVSVAAELCAFALGTDTAGSGRVPAGFNELVGLKPTRGRVSTLGVVPACRSLDCVSIFTHSVAEAEAVLAVLDRFDVGDPYSRRRPPGRPRSSNAPLRVGVPAQLEFFGDTNYEAAFGAAVERVRALGWRVLQIDFTPFRETAELLYGGPWVAERVAGIRSFFAGHRDALHPVTRSIFETERKYNAVDTFAAFDRLTSLQRVTSRVWDDCDTMLVPTAPGHYSVTGVLADPIRLNAQLGYYTNFVNLLDLCALAVPAGRTANGLPFGVTWVGPAWHDEFLSTIGRAWLGEPGLLRTFTEDEVELAVVGAHLRGLPLHEELAALGAGFVTATCTAPVYRLYALPGTVPPKPGMVRTGNQNGTAIEVEVYRLAHDSFGRFVAKVPPPLSVGTVELADGTSVKGFLCESAAIVAAVDISEYGGWRRYVGS